MNGISKGVAMIAAAPAPAGWRRERPAAPNVGRERRAPRERGERSARGAGNGLSGAPDGYAFERSNSELVRALTSRGHGAEG